MLAGSENNDKNLIILIYQWYVIDRKIEELYQYLSTDMKNNSNLYVKNKLITFRIRINIFQFILK